MRDRILPSLLVLATTTPALVAADPAPTYSRDVAPLFQEHCQSCHRPGQIGPMSLLTYDQVRPWARSIQRQVATRIMPPWLAAPGSRPMKGDRNLDESEIETIVAWVEAGAPEGDPSELPPPREFATLEGGWLHDQPDLVLQPSNGYTVSAAVEDEYRCFVIPTTVDHEVWLKGVEFQPGNSEVVHHLILFADPSGAARRADEATPEAGWDCGQMELSLARATILQMWAPGNVAPLYPQGIAKRIATEDDLVLQIHYHNVSGEDQRDHSRLGLHLAHPEETIDRQLRGQMVSAWSLDIPAGASNVEHEATWVASEDITIHSLGAHMHYRGRDIGLWATPPEREPETLIWVPRWDFDWQLTYEFQEPFRAPRGTRFEMVSHHDNSAENSDNPVVPPVDVKWGLASTDEMAFVGFSYTVDSERLGVTPRLPEAGKSQVADGR